MRIYVLREAMQELGLNDRQLHRLLADADIHPKVLTHDRRYQYITAEEFRHAQALYQQQQSLFPTRTRSQSSAEAHQDIPIPSESLPLPLGPSPPRRSGFTAQHIAPPVGWVFLENFARDHGVPKATAWGHIRAGKFTETTHEIPNRPGAVHHFLNPEQQEAALRYWHERYHGYQPCVHEACSCHIF